jgi:hypothetical protein
MLMTPMTPKVIARPTGGEQQHRAEGQAVPDILPGFPHGERPADADGGALGGFAHARGCIGGQRSQHGQRVLVAAALDNADGGDAVGLGGLRIGDQDGGAGLLHQLFDPRIALLRDGGFERRQRRPVARLEHGLGGADAARGVGVQQGERADRRRDGAPDIVVETHGTGRADIGGGLAGGGGNERAVRAADEDRAVGRTVDQAAVAQRLDDGGRPRRAGGGEAVHRSDDVVEGLGGEALDEGGVVLGAERAGAEQERGKQADKEGADVSDPLRPLRGGRGAWAACF